MAILPQKTDEDAFFQWIPSDPLNFEKRPQQHGLTLREDLSSPPEG